MALLDRKRKSGLGALVLPLYQDADRKPDHELREGTRISPVWGWSSDGLRRQSFLCELHTDGPVVASQNQSIPRPQRGVFR